MLEWAIPLGLLLLAMAISLAIRVAKEIDPAVSNDLVDPAWYAIDAERRLKQLDLKAEEKRAALSEQIEKAIPAAGGRVIAPGVYAFKTAFSRREAPLVPIPPFGTLVQREIEEPYFDREFIPANLGSNWTITCFFQNTRSFTHDVPGWPRSKQWSIDTNLLGNGGCVPRGHEFKIEGISLVPSRTTDPEVIDIIRDHATMELRMMASTPYMKWPADMLIPGPPRKQKESKWASKFQKAEAQAMEKSKGVLRLEKPIELLETESFMFQLKLSKDLPKPADLKLILHGKMRRPLCA